MFATDLNSLIKANPKAKKHAGSIRDALSAMRDLRNAGMAGNGDAVGLPYRGKISLNDAPKPSNKKPIRANSKLTILLDRQT